ncbi:DUF4136 domain-containing protein [Shewanella sp. NIFS-20-20]|uniref:DUF4136 domain-containing protein n=1 Tax=Shewanella sp. NIFS-20-20 TaxID=2853806 RepID=UPI001C43CD8D|nr:DUF4136 domain-containing protein [Shewanella sp. NIFS-20-20]MBV7316612.1 DUF4136 domain-containing protein [Shewanella sp. NIFS-20-20]
MQKLLMAVMVLALSACSSVQTSWDYNPEVNFSGFTTYAWVTQSGDESQYHLDGLMDERVRSAINNDLAAKGLTQTSQPEAQLLVNYLTKVDTKVDVDTFTNYYGYNPYYSYYGPGWGWGNPWGPGSASTQTQVREYDVGTLIVDIVDKATGKLIWRGSLSNIIRDKDTPQERTQFINEAVNKILANYPPKAGS